MLQQIEAQQFYTYLNLLSTVLSTTENSRIQGLFKALSDFPEADLIFKDFSRKPSKFKYFSSLWEPCLIGNLGRGPYEKHLCVISLEFGGVI